VATGCRSTLRAAARARFQRALSFEALGARLAAAYHDLHARSQAHAAVGREAGAVLARSSS
jgi:hypothetical protein